MNQSGVSVEKNQDGRRVLTFLKPYKKWVIADSFVIGISQVFSALIPTLALSWLIDEILPVESSKWLWGLMWLLILSAIIDLSLMVLDEYFCHQVAKSVTNKQKIRLFRHLQFLPFSFYHHNQSGELLARVSDDPDTLHNFLAWEGSTFMAAVQGVILYSLVLLWIHPYLMVTSLILGLVFYWMSNLVGLRTRAASTRARAEASRYLERLRESVTGIHLSRVLGVSDSEVESVASIRKEFVFHSQQELKARIQSIVVIGSFNGIALAAVYGISIFLIDGENLTSGQMLTAGGLVTIAANEMQRMLRNWLSVRRTGPALDRSEKLLAVPVSQAEIMKGYTKPSFDVRLEMKNVVFRYPGKDEKVINGLSLMIEPGDVVALVGPSGSGKSTITDLLLRFYELDEGMILFDGINITECDTAWLRSQFALVSQDIQLRNGSLAENLRIGNPFATDTELLKALDDSGLSEFYLTLSDGLNTIVGERGSLLSGGQKQRLSLARALVKNAPILILDEASSALDPITETKVNDAIRNRGLSQTVLIISHRLSTVLSANHIIVMENGRVVEEGTHNDLLQIEDSVYARMFKREANIGEGVIHFHSNSLL